MSVGCSVGRSVRNAIAKVGKKMDFKVSKSFRQDHQKVGKSEEKGLRRKERGGRRDEEGATGRKEKRRGRRDEEGETKGKERR